MGSVDSSTAFRRSIANQIYRLLLVLIVLIHCETAAQNQYSRSKFEPWHLLLQECEAELPDQCPSFIKALEQKCTIDNECVPPARCVNSICKCPNNYLVNDGICARGGLGDKCVNSVCVYPLICDRHDQCDCPSTMDRTPTGCKARCAKDEISINGTCFKLQKLNGQCEHSRQCQTAFSFCNGTKCECISGSEEKENACHPVYRCPDGQNPVLNSTSQLPLSCHSQTCASHELPTVPTKIKSDTCPENSYCVFPSYQDLLGFCCPERQYCPLGDPLPGKVCFEPRNDEERCPSDTHHCYIGSRGAVCCPLACPMVSGELAVIEQGVCYTRKALGDQCQVTAQCPPPAVCSTTCQCPSGHIKQFGPSGEKCQKVCQAGEVLVRSKCLPLSVPSKPCQHSSQCTAGSRCLSGKCECPCGSLLYNGYCVAKPYCPNFGYGFLDPLSATNDNSTLECSPTAPSDGSGTCPAKSFCYPAMVYSGGVCCPFPEPACPTGQRMVSDRNGKASVCDLAQLTNVHARCAADQYCYDYMMPILPSFLQQSLQRQGVCCWHKPVVNGRTITGPSTKHPVELCPPFHRTMRHSDGQIRRCNYYAYYGECIHGNCFLHRESSSYQVYQSGVCCVWKN